MLVPFPWGLMKKNACKNCNGASCHLAKTMDSMSGLREKHRCFCFYQVEICNENSTTNASMDWARPIYKNDPVYKTK